MHAALVRNNQSVFWFHNYLVLFACGHSSIALTTSDVDCIAGDIYILSIMPSHIIFVSPDNL